MLCKTTAVFFASFLWFLFWLLYYYHRVFLFLSASCQVWLVGFNLFIYVYIYCDIAHV